MKVVHLSKNDTGGAGRAAFRLHQGLRQCGVSSILAVDSKIGDDPHVRKINAGASEQIGKGIGRICTFPLLLYRNRSDSMWTISAAPRRTLSRVMQERPDVINLHWLGEGFLPLSSLRQATCPIVWTIHDMWAFTGGCHYDEECQKYLNQCGQCPQLGSRRAYDLSRWNWRYKQRAYRDVSLCIVSPSVWLSKCARQSPLLGRQRIEVIPNGLDLNTFHNTDKKLARNELGLPLDKTLLLFGAFNSTGNARKGFDLLGSAAKDLGSCDRRDNLFVVILGSSETYESLGLPLSGTCLGTIKDDRQLALAYSAADAFVAPSRQDNLPNTVVESLACGTPCVAFRIGGMPDMIDHGTDGYLANPFDPSDLARGILAVTRPDVNEKMCGAAREKAEINYGMSLQANRYLDLYSTLISHHSTSPTDPDRAVT